VGFGQAREKMTAIGSSSEQPQFIVSPGRENEQANGNANQMRARLIDAVDVDQIVVPDVSFLF